MWSEEAAKARSKVILSMMAFQFRHVQFGALRDFSAEAPDGAIIGIVGEQGSGTVELLRFAAQTGTHRYLGPQDALNLSPADVLLIEHTFAHADALVRARAVVALNSLRVSGATILLLSHEPALLRELCDEIWWLEDGVMADRGDPRQVLESYHQRIAEKFRAWGETVNAPLAPALRKGDGRAEIVALETLGSSGKPTMVWQCGEQVAVRVAVRFNVAVENPVIGIMIRTRIGLEVYGTNTDLEKVTVGPCAASETVSIRFDFRCDLCPKEYTLTAASHDPDGTAHDWVDDAVPLVVADSRYTAGVANLRAKVTVERVVLPPAS
jgi:ABC-type uncharacterized transport system ATPase subunit